MVLHPFSFLFVASYYSFNKQGKQGKELLSLPFITPMLQPQRCWQQQD
jgi:hypothetical protein